jgi:hypothetical protein
MAPEGLAEYDFCQAVGSRPRVSAREVAGRYELYTVLWRGTENTTAVVFASDSWEQVYLKGLTVARAY